MFFLEMNKNMKHNGEEVKENILQRGVVDTKWVVVAALCTAATLLVADRVDYAFPEPLDRSAPPDKFIADIAYEHLVNLTSIGPRVAGSYENEVAAVSVLVEAARGIAAAASQHNRVELDVFAASGAFALTFLDGMSNIYRDVQSVVIRVRGAGGGGGARGVTGRKRHALLLNCHYDTVPDSPGASDDAAGCAVVLETVRALAASPRPLRHDVIALLNGAEENILQASHAFVTTHRWAKSLRAFINIEACGAGGREVLFQAGPHDPWILEVYAGRVPHPFASSLAQELFESGLVPADTDFRIFRDYGNISGVDLAWNTNGYVYHTRLDTAERVPRAALQRTGDNVLALAHGLLSSENLETQTEVTRQPVFFDVLGVVVVLARPPAALLAAALAVALVLLKIYLTSLSAEKELYLPKRQWYRIVCRTLLCVVLSYCCGCACSLAVALALHAASANLSFYSHAGLLVPLYALPALCGSWWDARLTWGKYTRGGGSAAVLARGWWAARAWGDALSAGSALLLAAGTAAGLRSSFLPFLWTLPALGDVLSHAGGVSPGSARRPGAWAACSLLPALQTAYLALCSVRMFVPVMGRAGTLPVPPDMIMALVVSLLTLTAFSWMLPLVVAAKRPDRLIWGGMIVCAATCALVMCTELGFPYAAERPQRFMVFHTRRTVHADGSGEGLANQTHSDFYWVPELDANTPHSLRRYVPGGSAAAVTQREECARWLYCGAPYFLPVQSLVSRGHALPARAPPPLHLSAFPALQQRTSDNQSRLLTLDLHGPNHIVAIISPSVGETVSECEVNSTSGVLRVRPQPGPRWQHAAGPRETYFITLHDARSPQPWRLQCQMQGGRVGGGGGGAVQLSVAGHGMFGARARGSEHAALLAAFPPWSAVTGWPVALHIFSLQ